MNKDNTQKGLEWQLAKKWNPFNSNKLLAHVERWKFIKRGRPIPAPVLITVDPTNICNFNCSWCNAEYIRKHRNSFLSEKVLNDLADFLPYWGKQNFGNYGIEAICVAGGGEPLLNSATAGFIDRVIANNIEVGVVTNGSQIHNYIDVLSQCTWLGVSVDAGTAKTFNNLKGLKENDKTFEHIVNNMILLNEYAKKHHKLLGSTHPAYGISYKYLLYKDNISEIFEAAKLAKEIGCKNIHFRPAGTPWDKINTPNEINFTEEDIALFNEQISLAQELDDKNFNVYGITHKFSEQFERDNSFMACYSIFITALISPPADKTSNKDSFVLGLCCDRRGSTKLELLTDETDVNKINLVWGSNDHWKIHDDINILQECPRCTYQPHNQIYEQVILNDSMTYKFI